MLLGVVVYMGDSVGGCGNIYGKCLTCSTNYGPLLPPPPPAALHRCGHKDPLLEPDQVHRDGRARVPRQGRAPAQPLGPQLDHVSAPGSTRHEG